LRIEIITKDIFGSNAFLSFYFFLHILLSGQIKVDFIVGSTHPLNKDFMSDIDHWKKTIRNNCYDNFELTKCDIINESYEGEGTNEIALVKFVAKLVQVDSREKTSFMETSTFERAGKSIRNGAWLYKSGIIESAEEGMEIVEEDLSLSAKVN